MNFELIISILCHAKARSSRRKNQGRATQVFVACLLAFALPGVALAQPQRVSPHLGFVYPAGGRQGATFTVSVGGQNLTSTTTAHVSGPGVQARVTGYERPLTQKELNDLREGAQQLQDKRQAARTDSTKPPFTADDEKRAVEIRQAIATRGNRQANPALAETVTLEITLSPDAAPGERELRLKAPNGLSNPLVFCIGQLPEVGDTVATATSGRRPSRNRALDPGTGRPKTEMEIALPSIVNGQILPGEVDRYRFTAKRGQRLTLAVSARALIPYLADAVPGWFQPTLALFDARGRELAYDDDFRFNPDPALTCVLPDDGVYAIEIKDAIYRGREDFVYRLAVGELPFVTSIFPLGGKVAGVATFDLSGWNLAGGKVTMDTLDKVPGRFVLSVRNHGVFSNSVRFVLDAQRECLTAEPHELVDGAQPLTLPIIVNGRIECPGDEDVFRFEGQAGAEIVAEVSARRLGSPLDSVLTLADAAGRQLAVNDDFDDKGAGLLTHQADSRLQFTLPADGTYTVRLSDAQRHGGQEYGYRLRLGRAQPDFELRVVPSSVTVRAGASVPITVYALRRDGFTGEILLRLKNAPRGFVLSGGRIPPNVDGVTLTLAAPGESRDDPYDLDLIGFTTIQDKPVAHTAVPADDMMQAFAYHHLVPAKELKVCVMGKGNALRVLERLPVRLIPGGMTRLHVALPSRNFRHVTFELMEPLPGIMVRSGSCRDGVAELVLECDAKAKLNTMGNLILQAFGERSNGSPSKSPPRTQRSPLGTVPAISFEIIASTTARL